MKKNIYLHFRVWFIILLISQVYAQFNNNDSYFIQNSWLIMKAGAYSSSGRETEEVSDLSWRKLVANEYLPFKGVPRKVYFDFIFHLKIDYLKKNDSLDIALLKNSKQIYRIRLLGLNPYTMKFPISNTTMEIKVDEIILHPEDIRRKLRDSTFVKNAKYPVENLVQYIYSQIKNMNQNEIMRAFQFEFTNELIHSVNLEGLKNILIDPYGEYTFHVELNGKVIRKHRFRINN